MMQISSHYLEWTIDANLRSEKVFSNVQIDPVNNCNLRCPFCNVNFEKQKNKFMSDECFDRAVQMMQYATGALMIGCSCEVFLHPNFTKMLQKVPREYKERTYFSTNFASNISEEQMHDIAESNISFINISMESIQPDIYEKMRRGAKYEKFMKNLRTLRRILDEYPDAPKINITTVITEHNYSEIKDIFVYMQNNFKINGHEFRTPFDNQDVKYQNRLQLLPLITSAQFDKAKESVLAVDKQKRAIFVDYNDSNNTIAERSRNPILPFIRILSNSEIYINTYKNMHNLGNICERDVCDLVKDWNAIVHYV
jgi:MoaA/NifB/PqqE/SkfB family radical SAM enzyme